MTHRRLDFDLYLITDRRRYPDEDSLFEALDEALQAGVRAVQLREKDLPTRQLLAMARRLRELTSKRGAALLVNDRVDVALCVEADGVHLARSSMPVPAARRLMGQRALLGVSTHNHEEARSAEEEGADFIVFGPLYETPSKSGYGPPLGVEMLREVRALVALPVLGIGGITPERVGEVLSAGADGVAVIGGILGDADVRGAVKRFTDACAEEKARVDSSRDTRDLSSVRAVGKAGR
ncbi:MAG: thiamine phosphate synthase [Chloroflexota bacterium]